MRRLFAALLALFTAGCIAFHAKPIGPTRTLSAFAQRSLASPDLQLFLEERLHRSLAGWPPKTWDFQMLTLAALYYHPDLDLARAHWEVSKARIGTAAERPNPTVHLDPEFVSNAATGMSPWILGLAFDLPVETAGRRSHRITLVRELSEAERLRLALATWHVRSRLRASLLALFAARRKAAILKRKRRAERQIVRLVEERFKSGEVSRPDLTETQIALNQVLLALRQTRKEVVEGSAQLASALGVTAEGLEGVNIGFSLFAKLPPLAPPALSQIRRQALLNRPDLLAALAEYAASQATLRLQISRQYPNFHLGPGYLLDQGDNKWALQLSFALPVFNRNGGRIGEALALRKEAAARFMALQARALGEIDRASASYRAARGELATADALLAAEQRQLLAVKQMVAAGEAGELALQSAHLEAESARLEHLAALVEAQQSLGRLEDAVQHPLGQGEGGLKVPEKDCAP